MNVLYNNIGFIIIANKIDEYHTKINLLGTAVIREGWTNGRTLYKDRFASNNQYKLTNINQFCTVRFVLLNLNLVYIFYMITTIPN